MESSKQLTPAKRSDERRVWLSCLLLIALCLVIAFYPVFFLNRTLTALPGLASLDPPEGDNPPPPVLDSSSAYIDEPLARLAVRSLSQGRPPLWNSHSGLGQPLLGNMQSALLSPFRWPIMLFNSPLVWDLALFSRLLAGAFLALLLGKALGLKPLGATAAAISFSLTGYFVLHVNMHHLSVEVLLPGLLWALLKHMERPSPKKGLLLALFTWAVWVGGNPEATIFCALMAGLFLVWKGVCIPAPWKKIGSVLVWSLAGTLFAGPYLATGIEHLFFGLHHHSPLSGLDAYKPWTSAALLSGNYYSKHGTPVLPALPPWLGSATVALALIGCTLKPREKAFPSKLLAITAGLMLLKVFGLPGLNEVGRIPPLSMLLFFKYSFPAIALCLSLLAGRAVQGISENRVSTGITVVMTLGLPVALICLHWWNTTLLEGREDLKWLHRDLFPGLISPLVLGGFLLILKGKPSLSGLAALLLALLELVLLVPKERPLRHDPFKEPPFVKALKKIPGPVRVVSFQGILCPNVSAALGIDDIRINDAVIVGRFGSFAKNLIDGRMQGGILAPFLFPAFSKGALKEQEFFWHKDFYTKAAAEAEEKWRDKITRAFAMGNGVMDTLGITHVLVKEPEEAKGLWAKANGARWEYTGSPDGVTIYRNKLCRGRVFAPAKIAVAKGKAQALTWLKENASLLPLAGVVESPPASWNLGNRGKAGLTIAYHESLEGELVFSTETEKSCVIFVAEAWYPGRKAFIDGKKVSTRPADLCMTALEIPPGKHEVRVAMDSSSFKLGLILGVFGLLLAGLAIIIDKRIMTSSPG